MSTKYTGNYTSEASKIIKRSERLECQTTEDGTCYICNGFFLFKMNPMEYASIVQPVVCCDAGNWSINQNGRQERRADLLQIWTDSVKSAEGAATMEACPMVFKNGKAEIVGYYSAAGGFAATYNAAFMGAIRAGATFRAKSALSGAVAYDDAEPFALVLPIKPVPNICRAVKAYFAEPSNAAKPVQNSDKESKEIADLRDRLNAAQAEADTLRETISQQAAELASLRETAQCVQDPEIPQKETAESIVSRFCELPGIIATVKGAQTAAPVVWISGNVEQNAEAIKAAGARWSAKRGAYYYRVA